MEDVDFASEDLDATEDFLNRTYTRLRMSGTGERSSAHVQRRWLGDINADKLTIEYDLAFDANPLGRVSLCRVRSGCIVEKTRGRSTELFMPSEVRLFSPPELPFSGQLCEASYELVMFDPRLLDEVAAPAPGRRQLPVRLQGQRRVTKAAERRLSSVIDHLHELTYAVQEAPSPLVVSAMGQYLAASALDAFRNNALLEPTIEDRHDSAPVLLRRAIAFIDENAQRDISVTDISNAVYISPRALQYMFRRHRDCTPMGYVRRVRLHYAHRDLVAGNRTTTTVAEIATRWGFAHMGRFAVFYRQNYGQSPHVTLRGRS